MSWFRHWNSSDWIPLTSADIAWLRLALRKDVSFWSLLSLDLMSNVVLFTAVHERTMDNNESPWAIIKGLARESIRQKENTRFYLQQVDEIYCSNVAIFVSNLPPNIPQRHFERILVEILGKRKSYLPLICLLSNLLLLSHFSVQISRNRTDLLRVRLGCDHI